MPVCHLLYRRLSDRKAQDEFTRTEKTATEDVSLSYVKCNWCALGRALLKICQLKVLSDFDTRYEHLLYNLALSTRVSIF